MLSLCDLLDGAHAGIVSAHRELSKFRGTCGASAL
jgi:hypothetical protein